MTRNGPKPLKSGYDVMVACQLPKLQAIPQNQAVTCKPPKSAPKQINAIQAGCKPGAHTCAALALWVLGQDAMAREAARSCEERMCNDNA